MQDRSLSGALKIINMKINLEYPFNEDYKAGYLNINKEPRRLVLLVKKDNTKTSISYARYLMTCKLKRYLDKAEHVDHIDNNKMNDTIDNLQILSITENNKKDRSFRNIKAKTITLKCPVCNIIFEKRFYQITNKLKNNKIPTCSRKCGGIYSHRKIK